METLSDYEQWKAKRQEHDAAAANVVLSQPDLDQPDAVAGDMNLATEFAKSTGKPQPPLPLVKEYRSVFQQQVEQARTSTILSSSPMLAEWLRRPDNAAVARDDLENLSWWETTLGATGNAVSRGVQRLPQSYNQFLATSVGQRAQDQQASVADIWNDELQRNADDPWFGLLNAIWGTYNRSVSAGVANLFGATPEQSQANAAAYQQQAGQIAKQIASVLMSPAATAFRDKVFSAEPTGDVLADVGQFLTDLAADPGGALAFLAETAVESAPSLAAATAVTAATRNPTAGAAVMGGLSFVTEGGTDAASFFAEKGIDVSTPEGAMQAMSDPALIREAGERGVLRGLIVGVMDGLSGGIAGQQLVQSPLGNVLVQSIVQAVMGGAGEAGAQLATDGTLDMREVIIEALAEFVTAPVEVAGVGGRAFLDNQRKARDAEARQTLFKELSGQATASKLRERMPDAFRQFLEKATANGPVENVYIPADQFVQYFQGLGVDPFALADQLEGTSAADLETALATGGDLQMPTATYAAKIAGSEHDQFLMENMRFDPDEFTSAEAKAFNEKAQDALQEAYEIAEAVRREDEQYKSFEAEIYDTMVERLRIAGRSTDVATTEALLYPAFYRVMAERSGMTIEEFMQRYPLPQVRGDVPAGLQPKNVDELTRTLAEARSRRTVKDSRQTLLEFISDYGGITDDGGELRARDAEAIKRQGKKTIKLRRNSIADGMVNMFGRGDGKRYGFDDVAQAAIEAGYLADDPVALEWLAAQREGRQVPDIGRALLDAIDRELAGQPQYSAQDMPAVDQEREAELDQIEAYLSEIGLSLQNSDEEIRAALDGQRMYAQDGQIMTDSAAFKRWFGASKVVDENGEPLVVYHGTTGDFDAFDRSRASPESDLGAGFYFSNTPADVDANYAGEGPDLTNKLERISERIDDEIAVGALPEDTDIKALARERLGVQHGGATVPVYLSIQNPVVLGGDAPTFVESGIEYDPDAEDAGPVETGGGIAGIIAAIRQMSDDEEFLDINVDQLAEDLNDAMYDGMDARELIDAMKVSEGLSYAMETENGDLAVTEIIRRAFEAVGYDGFIDYTVNEKFGSQRRTGKSMTGMDEGTVHYVAFRPTQIKSIFNRGTFDPNDPRILYQVPPEQARRINMPVELPTDPLFAEAVANTPGAEITADGVVVDLVRFQKPEQEGGTSVRTGVFYLPAGSKNARHYKGGDGWYGGKVEVRGATLLKRPLFVKGATGGKAPEAAYDALRGKGAMKKLDSAVFSAINQSHLNKIDPGVWEEIITNLLNDYGADGSMAYEIIANSKQGNQLRYALQENIIAHAVREAGYDAVVGYSKGKAGPFISEVFDVREIDYPVPGQETATLHPMFEGRSYNQPAYHGTPHLFDKFSMDKIGTGEGAQAYGWGLYFASSKGVAEWYRHTLTRNSQPLGSYDGKDYAPNDLDNPRWLAIHTVKRHSWILNNAYTKDPVPAVLEQAEREMRALIADLAGDLAANKNSARYKSAVKEADQWQAAISELANIDPRLVGDPVGKPGRLYAVDVPSDDELLVWDAPLSEQPESVRERLYQFAVDRIQPRVLPRSADTNAVLFPKEVGGQIGLVPADDPDPIRTALSRHSLSSVYGWMGRPKDVSLALSAAGIPGLRYLDGSSRSAGDGSYNYVIFDDNRVSITGYEQRFGDGPRGSIQFPAGGVGNGDTVINLFRSADLSTMLHESGHYFLTVLQDMAARGEGGAQTDILALQAWWRENAKAVAADANRAAGASKNSLNQSAADSAAFKRWFGASKVVDENGEPLVVYHGGPEGVEAFESSSWRYREFMVPEARDKVVNANFFTKDRAIADSYRAKIERQNIREGDTPGAIYEVYVSLKNPLEVDWGGKKFTTGDPGALIDQARAGGHDGIIVTNVIDDYRQKAKPTTIYVPFSSEQIKSVNNRGTFDPNDPRILMQQDIGGTASGDPIQITEQDVIAALENGTTGDSVKDMLIDVGMQEQFARAFEAYLMEGKAPSVELRSAFEKFRAWLISIYQKLAGLNVTITDEVRQVFDRMIASDAEIAKAQQETAANAPMFPSADDMGLTADEYAAFLRAYTQSEDDAKARLMREAMAPVKRAKEKWFKDERAKAKEEVERNTNAQPVYRAIEWMANRRWIGDDKPDAMPDFRMSKDIMVQRYGEGVLKTLPRGLQTVYAVDGGLDPDEAAGWFGFESGDEMIKRMEQAPKRVDLIEAEADRVMRERHGDVLNDGQVEAEALDAVHNDTRGRVIATELKALYEIWGQGAGITHKEARALARQILSRVKTRDAMNASRFLTAERKAGEKATRLYGMVSREGVWANRARAAAVSRARGFAGGDGTVQGVAGAQDRANAATGRLNETIAELVTAKQQQLINHMLYAESRKIADEVEKAERFVATLSKKSTRDRLAGDYLEAIDELLDRYDFRRMSGRAEDKRGKLLAFVERMKADGRENELAIPDAVMKDAQRVPYKTLPVEHLRGVIDSLKNIAHTARLKRKLLDAQAERDLDAVVGDIVQAFDENLPKRPPARVATTDEGRRNAVRQFLDLVLNATTLLREIDGFKDQGAAYRNIKGPIDAAMNRLTERRTAAAEALDKLYSVYSKDDRRQMAVRTLVPELGYALSKWERIAIALNTGNAGNLQRLTDPKVKGSLTPDQVKAVLATLDERDAKFVQSVWNYLDSFRPDIEAREKRKTGVAPEWVEAQPVEIAGVTLKGGYYPLKYDARLSSLARDDAEQEIAQSLQAGRFGKAQTRNGHLKERASSSGRAVEFDMSVLHRHVNQVVYDLELSEPVANAWRIIQDGRIRDAFRQAGRDADFTALETWLLDVGTGEARSADLASQLARRFKSNFTASKLALNLGTVAMQVTGLTQSMVVVGKKNMVKGIVSSIRPDAVSDVVGKSSFMASRQTTFNKDIFDFYNDPKLGPVASRWGDFKSNVLGPVSFWLMTKVQFHVVDVPTWLAGYQQGLRKFGNDEAKAIAHADDIVKRAQASGLFSDRSAIERGSVSRTTRQNDVIRLFTTLASYMFAKFNVAYERSARAGRTIKSEGLSLRSAQEAVSWSLDMAFLFTVEALLAAAIKGRLPGDDEDDEDWATFIASETAFSVMSTIPFIRDVAGAMSGFEGGGAYGGITKELAEPFKQGAQGEVDRAFVKSAINATGLWLGLPSTQINRALDAGWRAAEGEDVSPLEYLLGRAK